MSGIQNKQKRAENDVVNQATDVSAVVISVTITHHGGYMLREKRTHTVHKPRNVYDTIERMFLRVCFPWKVSATCAFWEAISHKPAIFFFFFSFCFCRKAITRCCTGLINFYQLLYEVLLEISDIKLSVTLRYREKSEKVSSKLISAHLRDDPHCISLHLYNKYFLVILKFC